MKPSRYPIALLLATLPLAACGEEPQAESPPQQITASTFQYPEDLWDAGVEGETTLRIFITATGAVDSAQVEESSGHEEFDSAAVEGAHRLRFEPPMRGDQPTSGWFLLPVQFEIEPAAAPADAAGAEAGADTAEVADLEG